MNDDDEGGLALLDAGPKGRGVFASRGFRAGDTLLTFKGRLCSPGEVTSFTHAIQVDVDVFLEASGGVDDYVNHSCEPNCGLRSSPPRLDLVALRDIEPGEEITFDYSTCIVAEPEIPVCMCGAPACRGRVSSYWRLDRATRARYQRLGIVPGFVLRSGRPSVNGAVARRNRT